MTRRSASALALGSFLALALALGATACSPVTPGVSGGDGGDGGDGGSGSGNSGAGASGATTTDDGEIKTSTDTETNFEECAAATEAAATLPLNMFIAIDKSGSMANNSKWTKAKAAFLGYFQDPENTNPESKVNVALRFWPDGDCNATTCNINACSNPQVPLGPLADPDHVQSLVSLYNSKNPDGNTPMYAALGGAAKWGIENAQTGEGATATVIIFVTDGEPVGCDENINNIAQHASNAFSTAQVKTFAVGLAGSKEADMAKLAVAGGTGTPFLIGNGDAQADLSAALKEIQKTTLACVFAMPEAQGPDPIDKDLVNLTYTPAGAEPVTISKVEDATKCDSAGGWGWYYDDNEKPNIIQLCPALCDNVQKFEGGKINIVLGCQSKVE